MYQADKAKKTAEKANEAMQKKCKYCGQPLKTDAEKQKEMCANCALQRM